MFAFEAFFFFFEFAPWSYTVELEVGGWRREVLVVEIFIFGGGITHDGGQTDTFGGKVGVGGRRRRKKRSFSSPTSNLVFIASGGRRVDLKQAAISPLTFLKKKKVFFLNRPSKLAICEKVWEYKRIVVALSLCQINPPPPPFFLLTISPSSPLSPLPANSPFLHFR